MFFSFFIVFFLFSLLNGLPLFLVLSLCRSTFERILGADTSWDVLGLSRESATEADIAEAIERLQSLQRRTVDYQSEHNAEQIKKKVCDAFVNLSGEAAREEYNEELDERADEAGAKVQAAPPAPPAQHA